MAATFEITAIAPRTRADAAGGFVNVQQVTFTTKPSAIVGVVDIPVAAFTPDEVNKVVERHAALLETVKAL